MNPGSEIIPALLPRDEKDLLEKAAELPIEIPLVHFDVIEGEDIWAPIGKDLEAHLMVEHPAAIAGRWLERGAKRIIVHTVDDALTKCREKAEVGIAIEIDKTIEEFAAFMDFVDFIHLMSIKEIGHQGHPFDDRVFDRIKEAKEKFPHLPISVDGGITLKTYKKLQDAGATRLIVGSHFKEIWNSLTNA
jgi:ribulose-phosphate 3-epimerase